MRPVRDPSAPAGSWLVNLAGLVVPTSLRRSWREEWAAELDALEHARASTPDDHRLPSPHLFALGALRHALALRQAEWTMDSIFQDIRFSLRLLVRAPAFTLLTALTLALGIGANGVIFSFINGVLLRPPAAIAEPDRLVQIARSYESAPRWDSWSWLAMETIAKSPAMSGVAGYAPEQFVIGRGDDTEALSGQVVTGNYFDVLGVKAYAGRLLESGDDQAAPTRAAVMSHALWKRRFASAPGVVGSSLRLGSKLHRPRKCRRRAGALGARGAAHERRPASVHRVRLLLARRGGTDRGRPLVRPGRGGDGGGDHAAA
jgi:hypothetical protein